MGKTDVAVVLDVNARRLQEWVRPIHAAEACGLGKSRFYELLNESGGKIKSCVLKSPGARRGARLVNLSSLFAYIEGLAKEQQ
jgi:hypothetical protein